MPFLYAALYSLHCPICFIRFEKNVWFVLFTRGAATLGVRMPPKLGLRIMQNPKIFVYLMTCNWSLSSVKPLTLLHHSPKVRFFTSECTKTVSRPGCAETHWGADSVPSDFLESGFNGGAPRKGTEGRGTKEGRYRNGGSRKEWVREGGEHFPRLPSWLHGVEPQVREQNGGGGTENGCSQFLRRGCAPALYVSNFTTLRLIPIYTPLRQRRLFVWETCPVSLADSKTTKEPWPVDCESCVNTLQSAATRVFNCLLFVV